MIQNCAIDADSIVHKIYHRNKEKSLEHMYIYFCIEIAQIQQAFYFEGRKQNLEIDWLILLSPKKTFRNDLTDEYKSNRPEQPQKITDLKYMVNNRFQEKCIVLPNVEADDIIVDLMNNTFFWGSAIDKDIIKASRQKIWNYNKRKWEYPDAFDTTEQWYIYQSLLGDKVDGIEGAPGIGTKKAENFLLDNNNKPSYESWVSMFESEERAILMMRLVRMDQYTQKKGLVLWNKNDWKF